MKIIEIRSFTDVLDADLCPADCPMWKSMSQTHEPGMTECWSECTCQHDADCPTFQKILEEQKNG